MEENKLILDRDNPPSIPRDVAVCPICGADIVIEEITEWYANGEITECGLHINCSTEPDIDSESWEGWFDGHWSMPYVDWLPVEKDALEWLNEHYVVSPLTMQDEQDMLTAWNTAAKEFAKQPSTCKSESQANTIANEQHDKANG